MVTNLKIERIRSGMRQWELAGKVGIDTSKLSLIESGRLVPSEELKKAISKALNKPVKIVFGE